MALTTVQQGMIGTQTSVPMTYGNLGAGDSSIMKNRIINGAMTISQRGTSFASSSVSNGDYQLDRWSTWCNNGSANATVAQSSTAPAGFANSLLFTNVTAVTVGSADRAQLIQPIEGFNFYDLGFGTANAKTVTLSFWVNCSLTGQFGGSLQNFAGNRSYPFAYTITSANTWQQVSITIAGDTSGTWVGASNAGSAQLNFDMGCGSTLKGTAGAWAGVSYRGATGDVNLTANAGATFYITGVQLEVGSSATGFEYVNYQTSLANCQRYYYQTPASTIYISRSCAGQAYSTSGFEGAIFSFPVTMRTGPTLINNNLTFYSPYLGRVSSAGTIGLYQSFTDSAVINATGVSSFTTGSIYYVSGNSSAYAGFNAEL